MINCPSVTKDGDQKVISVWPEPSFCLSFNTVPASFSLGGFNITSVFFMVFVGVLKFLQLNLVFQMIQGDRKNSGPIDCGENFIGTVEFLVIYFYAANK